MERERQKDCGKDIPGLAHFLPPSASFCVSRWNQIKVNWQSVRHYIGVGDKGGKVNQNWQVEMYYWDELFVGSNAPPSHYMLQDTLKVTMEINGKRDSHNSCIIECDGRGSLFLLFLYSFYLSLEKLSFPSRRSCTLTLESHSIMNDLAVIIYCLHLKQTECINFMPFHPPPSISHHFTISQRLNQPQKNPSGKHFPRKTHQLKSLSSTIFLKNHNTKLYFTSQKL